MSSAAASSQRNDGSGTSPSTRCGQAAIAFAFAIVLLSGLVWTDGDSYVVSIKDLDSDVVVVSLANLGFPMERHSEAASSDDAVTDPAGSDTSPVAESANVAPPAPPALAKAWMPDAVAHSRQKLLPKFVNAYRSLLKLVAVMGLSRIQDNAALTHATIVGTASTYNPYRDGGDADSMQTASGEPYDPDAWTAAIQTGLRAQFGGVRYGRLYQPAYALVASGDKQIIVRINDVGPLKPGRVIDLNERSMRYFDPLLRRGLLNDIKITLLPDADWTPGPVDREQLFSVASAQ